MILKIRYLLFLYLVLTGRPTFGLLPLVVHVVKLSHSVHQVVHAGQVGSHADLKLVHGLVPSHGVET